MHVHIIRRITSRRDWKLNKADYVGMSDTSSVWTESQTHHFGGKNVFVNKVGFGNLCGKKVQIPSRYVKQNTASS